VTAPSQLRQNNKEKDSELPIAAVAARILEKPIVSPLLREILA
jgi:hypothetical protein